MSETILQVLTAEQRLERYIQVCTLKQQLYAEVSTIRNRYKELGNEIKELDRELADMTRQYTSGQQVLGVV